MWFSVVYTLIDNVIHHHSGQNVVDPGESTTKIIILTTVMTNIVVNTDNAKPQSICFLPQYQRERKCLRAEKGLA